MKSRKPTGRASPSPTETMQRLVDAKHERTRQTPDWPGAEEQARPRHAQPVADQPPPRDIEKKPPPEAGHERDDINQRHH